MEDNKIAINSGCLFVSSALLQLSLLETLPN